MQKNLDTVDLITVYTDFVALARSKSTYARRLGVERADHHFSRLLQITQALIVCAELGKISLLEPLIVQMDQLVQLLEKNTDSSRFTQQKPSYFKSCQYWWAAVKSTPSVSDQIMELSRQYQILAKHIGSHLYAQLELRRQLFNISEGELYKALAFTTNLNDPPESFFSLAQALRAISASLLPWNKTNLADKKKNFITDALNAMSNMVVFLSIDNDKWYSAQAILNRWLHRANQHKESDNFSLKVSAWSASLPQDDDLLDDSVHNNVYTIKLYFELEAYYQHTDPSKILTLATERRQATETAKLTELQSLNTQQALDKIVKDNQNHNKSQKWSLIPKEVWSMIFTYLGLNSSVAAAKLCQSLNTNFNNKEGKHWQFFFNRSNFSTLNLSKGKPVNDYKEHLRDCLLMEKKKKQLAAEISTCRQLIDDLHERHPTLTSVIVKIPEEDRKLLAKCESDMQRYLEELETLENNSTIRMLVM